MKIIENPELPKEVFSQKVVPQLLAQAVRVYAANQRQGTQSALTRAEVNRTRKKLYKQKGTGGARHGDRKAPIFVGGGIAFAPKPRDYTLSLSKKMKQKALIGAFSEAVKNKKLVVVNGFATLTGKTKELYAFLNSEDEIADRNILVVTDGINEMTLRSGRNIPGLVVAPAEQLTAFQIVKAQRVYVEQSAIKNLTTRLLNQEQEKGNHQPLAPIISAKSAKKGKLTKQPKSAPVTPPVLKKRVAKHRLVKQRTKK